jgi:hypothetical protein
MEFTSIKMVDQLATDCLQISLSCTQEEVRAISNLGRLCAPLLPCDTHPEFIRLTFYDIVNKRLVVRIPPEYSDKEIEARARRECLQLHDDLENLNRRYRQERYDLGQDHKPSISRRANYGT